MMGKKIIIYVVIFLLIDLLFSVYLFIIRPNQIKVTPKNSLKIEVNKIIPTAIPTFTNNIVITSSKITTDSGTYKYKNNSYINGKIKEINTQEKYLILSDNQKKYYWTENIIIAKSSKNNPIVTTPYLSINEIIVNNIVWIKLDNDNKITQITYFSDL